MKVNNDDIYRLILEQTKKFLQEKGVRGFNMDQLAAASGVAKNTLYKMIGSKEEIVFKAIFDDVNKLQGQLEEMVQQSTYRLQLPELSLFFTQMFSSYGRYIKDVLVEYPTNGRIIQENMSELREMTIKMFRERMAMGLLREDLDPELLFQILEGVTIQFIRSDDTGEELAKRLTTAYDYILEGIKR